MKKASLEPLEKQKTALIFLRDPSVDKNQTAREIASEKGIASGPVCVISTLEPSPAFEHRGKHIIRRTRPCHVLYQYQIHPETGWMHARIQTWFPFNIQVGLNGREWLARQMEMNWTGFLNGFAAQLNPEHESIFRLYPASYYCLARRIISSG